MTNKLFLKILIAVSVLLLSGGVLAQEVPPHLVHQGRLMDAQNAPINGTRDLTFNLYAEETGGTSFWTETQTVLLTEGFYSVTLGQGQALDLSQFDGAVLYLGVTIDGEELAPRMALRSVPYAIKSGTSQNAMTAENVTGDITPNSVMVGNTVIDSSGITINGATVIDGSGQWAGPAPVADYDTILNPPFTFDNLNCANGDVAQFVGGAWTCTPASSADTLSGLGCAEGQTAKFIAGAWSCADDIDTDTDTDTTYIAGNGITIGAANDIAADTTILQTRVFGTCSAGFSIRQVNADGSVVCEDDSDTTYTAGAGVTITGANNAIAVDTTAIQGRVTGSCVAGESIRQINADGTVVCEPDTDTDTNTTYSADPTGGLVLSGANAFGIANNAITSARIADGTIANADLAVGAVNSASIADGTVASVDIADGTVTSADITNGTILAADTDTNSVQARVTGICAANESIRTIAANGTVTCEPDSDTTYTAGTGLNLSGANQFSVNNTYLQGEVVNTMYGCSGVYLDSSATWANRTSDTNWAVLASRDFTTTRKVAVSVDVVGHCYLEGNEGIHAQIYMDNAEGWHGNQDIGWAMGSVHHHGYNTNSWVQCSTKAVFVVDPGAHRIEFRWKDATGGGAVNWNGLLMTTTILGCVP